MENARVLEQLHHVCASRGLAGLAERLSGLGELCGEDLRACEASLRELDDAGSHVRASAAHLLSLGGKRLRPLCVALAARVGHGFFGVARELAVAVELVHAATLLHDDVVDLGETRRGAPAARVIWGNAASIFAGDWLLVEALRRVRRARVPGALDRLLEVIERMILAESAQLENRGRLDLDRRGWLDIVEGKTAALFRWALWAGGRAGGLDAPSCRALEDYGLHLGVAFQAVDDLLDLTGDPRETGKALFADLREGKMTFPLIVALERDPALAQLIREDSDVARRRVLDGVVAAGGSDACLALARERAAAAAACLEGLPPGPARAALATVAEAAIARDR